MDVEGILKGALGHPLLIAAFLHWLDNFLGGVVPVDDPGLWIDAAEPVDFLVVLGAETGFIKNPLGRSGACITK